MNKPITPTLHGIIDYGTVLMTAAAPSLFGFSERAANTCYALAGGYLALSAVTDYPLAAKRLVPFPAHGAAEGALGAALPLLPALLGFSRDRPARNFLLGLTAVTAVVASLTDWTANERFIGEQTPNLPLPGARRAPTPVDEMHELEAMAPI